MLKILIPTDFSTHSYNALCYAQLLFQKEDVEFTLYHAYEPSALQILGNKSPQQLASIYEGLKSDAIQKLEDLRAKIQVHNFMTSHSYLLKSYDGHLKEGIDQMEYREYDFIVMGSKGATGLKELFLGSVTYSIVSLHQEIPILIIPENANFERFERIGFETSFKSDYSKMELEPLIKLLKSWDATVHTFQVFEKPELTKKQELHLEHLWSLLKSIKSSFHVVPKFKSLEKSILIFEEELDIDVLVLINEPQTFLDKLMNGSLIKKMTFHTRLPFLVLPDMD